MILLTGWYSFFSQGGVPHLQPHCRETRTTSGKEDRGLKKDKTVQFNSKQFTLFPITNRVEGVATAQVMIMHISRHTCKWRRHLCLLE